MKNKSWIAGFVAVVAVAANGCAGGAESATMMTPDGITLSPAGESTVDNALPSASADMPLPGVDQTTVQPAAEGASAMFTLNRSCAVADTGSNTMATAQFLGSCLRGALVEADGGQHFVFNPEPGVDYSMRIVTGGDATFDLGVATTNASGERTCAVFTAGRTSARFSSDGSAGNLCVVVRSDTGSAQSFRLGLTH